MYAVIVTGGKQYKVKEGDVLQVEKLDKNVGDKVELEMIMLADGEKVLLGDEVKGKSVKAEIVANGKDKKVVVFKYKAKKNVRKKMGHRQPFSQIKIVKIG